MRTKANEIFFTSKTNQVWWHTPVVPSYLRNEVNRKIGLGPRPYLKNKLKAEWLKV
jgi:hypothetical protein